MTYYLDLRSAPVGGSVNDPRIVESNPESIPLTFMLRTEADLTLRTAGKDVLLVAHGFNVDRENGVRELGRLEAALALDASESFLGVLWPGDWWIPAVNYPFEGQTAIKAGRKLAAFCNKTLTKARSLSFASHSLGARLVLEAVENLRTKPRAICLTAGAINDDCLSAEYKSVVTSATAIANLASREDDVLRLAYPVGDVIADVLHLDHVFGEPALGRSGPDPANTPGVSPSQIKDCCDYGHGDYLPPYQPPPVPDSGKWTKVATYVGQAFRKQKPSWP